MVIHKQPVPIVFPTLTLTLPRDTTILCVKLQHGDPFIWYSHDGKHDSVTKLFAWQGTGHKFEDNQCTQYIGTILTENDSEVWHLFMGK